MCASNILKGVATGGISTVVNQARKQAAAPQRKAVREAEAAVIQKANLRRQASAVKKKKLEKQGTTRSQQIAKFSANVSRGGAKRAANVGR